MTTVASKLVLAVAGLAASVSGLAATAAAEVPSVTVRYDDLNLSTAAGVDQLYRRISMAAQRVCPLGDLRDLRRVQAAERCQAAALANAVNKVNSPSLAMLHAARGSRG